MVNIEIRVISQKSTCCFSFWKISNHQSSQTKQFTNSHFFHWSMQQKLLHLAFKIIRNSFNPPATIIFTTCFFSKFSPSWFCAESRKQAEIPFGRIGLDNNSKVLHKDAKKWLYIHRVSPTKKSWWFRLKHRTPISTWMYVDPLEKPSKKISSWYL